MGLSRWLSKELAERYPRITYRVVEADTPTLSEMLLERKIDLAISRTWSSAFGDDFATEFLYDESLFVVAGTDSQWSKRRKIDFAELLNEPWVLPEFDNLVGTVIVDAFRRAGMALPVPQVVSNSMAVRTRLVESGRFLTMLPKSILHFGDKRRGLKTLPVASPLKPQAAEVTTLKSRTPNAVARILIEELRIVTQPLRKGT